MPIEIEKKYLIGKSSLEYLRKNFDHEITGIAQWYSDKGLKNYESTRIRLIVYPDGKEKWIAGNKKSINNSLIFREENESEIKLGSKVKALKDFPYVLKLRYTFHNYQGAELVVDEFPDNPFVMFDIRYLMEIELSAAFGDPLKTFDDVYNFFNIPEAQDVSEDLSYTNHAIARRSTYKSFCQIDSKAIRDFLYEKIKVVEKR
jgi:CYTH domain-containing protein